MRKKKGSIISLLAALVFLVLICSAAPTIAPAAPTTGTTGIWCWSVLDDNTLSVTGCTYDPSGALTLPGSLDTGSAELGILPVTRIENNAFDKCYDLTSVDMSGCSSLTSIGDYAFMGNINLYPCSNLETVIMPNSVESVGKDVFYFCDNLTSVTLSSNLQNIGDSMFNNCRKLTGITIPGSVTSIGKKAFYYSGLTSIAIPDSVAAIGDAAFSNCSSLVSVTLPDNVNFTRIPDDIFFDALNLTTTNISELTHVEYIGTKAFHRTAVESISIPDSVAIIGNCAFQYCESLESVTLPTNAAFTGIPDYAFSGCASLASVTIPESVTSIGERVFEECSALEEINVDADNGHFSGLDGVLFNYDKTRLICHPAGRSGSFDIPAGVTSIDDFAFAGSSCLTGVSIPDSVTSIGEYAFFNCNNTALTEITIPGSVAGIGNFAFDGCSSLEQITIGEGVTSIGDYTFNNCSGLSEIALPESITGIGSYVFFSCGGLTEITIPKGVGSIGDLAFGFCPSLTKAVILSSSTSFGSNVFLMTDISSEGIYGLDGSAAQDYAETNSIPFHIIKVVSFNSGAGSAVSDIIAIPGGKITAPANPTRPGFDFNGWYKDMECTDDWDFDNDTVTEDITLYARWSQNASTTYALTITAGTGGSITTGSSGNYAAGAVINIAAVASANYSFNNWTYTGGGSFVNASSAVTTFTMPAGATTITATFTYNGGSSGGGSGGGGNSPQPVSSSTGLATFTPSAGGSVSLGSDVALNIPANALQGNNSVQVAMQKVDTPPPAPSGFMVMGTAYEFTVNGQDHYSFDKPVTLTFTFDPSKLAPGETPAVHYYDEEEGRWVNIGGTVSSNTITVTVDHFTKFAVMAVEKAVQPQEQEPSARLTDIAGHWAEKNIEILIAMGAVSGYPDGKFKPDAGITRAEFTAMLVKAFSLQGKGDRVFADTAGHWAREVIATAASCGIIGGYDPSTFGPDDPVTREQMAVMTVKAARLSQATGETAFADRGKISTWAREYVNTAVQAGIIKGYSDNAFRPGGKATRAEAVTMIANALN